MNWFQWLSLIALVVCLGILFYHIIRLIQLGSPEDYAAPAGSIRDGIKYSITGAMNPKKKESAYLHLPTYTAGLIYHAGTFLTILIFLLSFFVRNFPDLLRYFMMGFLLLSGISGMGILIKRASKRIMRRLSNIDDYLSNLLVTIFQIATILYLGIEGPDAFFYYLAATLLLFYIPVGKLKHMIYFFAARYHLGWFYGSRGTWPPKSRL